MPSQGTNEHSTDGWNRATRRHRPVGVVRRRCDGGPARCVAPYPVAINHIKVRVVDRPIAVVRGSPLSHAGIGASKVASGASAGLRGLALRFATGSLRCSACWPVAELTSLTALATFKQAATNQITMRAARAAGKPVLLGGAHSPRPGPTRRLAGNRVGVRCPVAAPPPAQRNVNVGNGPKADTRSARVSCAAGGAVRHGLTR